MVDDFIGLIPAAGKGLRLGLPYPKELYPVIRDNHYKPIAQFVLTNLTVAGLQHVVFVINETNSQFDSLYTFTYNNFSLNRQNETRHQKNNQILFKTYQEI